MFKTELLEKLQQSRECINEGFIHLGNTLAYHGNKKDGIYLGLDEVSQPYLEESIELARKALMQIGCAITYITIKTTP